MIGHQARVLERSIFESRIDAGKQTYASNKQKERMFPMFFHGNRAIFSAIAIKEMAFYFGRIKMIKKEQILRK